MIAEILLVEDNPGDAHLFRHTLSETGADVNLHVVDDGTKALDYLHRRNGYAAASPPDVVILDLNLPNKSGFDVQAEAKGDAALCHIPIIILTTSRDREDVRKSYGLHANSFLTKPLQFDEFSTVVQE